MNKISVILTFWEGKVDCLLSRQISSWWEALYQVEFLVRSNRANLHAKKVIFDRQLSQQDTSPQWWSTFTANDTHTHTTVIHSTPTSSLQGSPGLGWVTALRITRAYSGESEFSGKIISSLGVVKASLWEKTDKNTEWRGTYVWDR